MKNMLRRRSSANAKTADSSRRSFFWKLGAGVTGGMASVVGLARAEPADSASLSLEVALLNEEKALRKLHQAFERAMDRGQYEMAIESFSDDAKVVFNGGIFDNRSRGVRRLFLGRFRSGKTGKAMEPAPGFELDPSRLQDRVEVAPNLRSATAIFPYSIQVGMPIESEGSIASMARLQGDGVQTWWEGGEYRVTYRRDAVDERWQIARLEYHTMSRANYRSGRSHATAMALPPDSTLYPEDSQGPDALI